MYSCERLLKQAAAIICVALAIFTLHRCRRVILVPSMYQDLPHELDKLRVLALAFPIHADLPIYRILHQRPLLLLVLVLLDPQRILCL